MRNRIKELEEEVRNSESENNISLYLALRKDGAGKSSFKV